MQTSRRDFLHTSLTGTAAVALTGAASPAFAQPPSPRPPRIRFGVVGLNHGHINGQVETVTRGGGQIVSFFAQEPDLAAAFATRFPAARQARTEQEVLEDPSIQLILTAAVPNERAPLGIRAMRHGKDVMSGKPAATTSGQVADLRRAHAETKRFYSVLIERHESQVINRAGALVKAGAIGRVLQTIGMAPHLMNPDARPRWFFERERYGGVLCDLASHNIDAFLFLTGSTRADIVASQAGNLGHPQHPGLEDFGDVMLRGDGGLGYIRVDWFTPRGLQTFGDARLTILGTEGYMELRKNVDIAGRPGAGHLFLVDHKGARHIDCSDEPLPYGERVVDDVLNRTETADAQTQTFLALDLGVQAQQKAQRAGAPLA